MAGIYFHIPFCRKACVYCDFHFSTSPASLDRVHAALLAELERRAHELKGRSVGTIYFGGGTPSILPPERIEELIRVTRQLFHLEDNVEVTLETNPDDISNERVQAWKEMGITRPSIGIQSFKEERLHFMGRAHSATQALNSIKQIAGAGFHSWTIDLIYGIPGMTMDEWDEQLTLALDHGMPHLSAYCLTVEPRTALAHRVKDQLVRMPEDDVQGDQFDRLMERMEKAGLVHYEISNFGLPGHASRHNMAYWEGVHYLGIGPSAHSFDGQHRRWNISNNVRYAAAVEKGETWWDQEELTPEKRTNELLLTGLRTIAGVPLDRLEIDAIQQNMNAFRRHLDNGLLSVVDRRLVLTKAGRHFADRIASDLFVTTDDR